MFEQLVRDARHTETDGEPVLFGQLLLPNESVERPLVAGSGAPMVGVVMALQKMRRHSNGTLTLVAHGVCRFGVRRPTQSSPYSRADVELRPDEEELSGFASPLRKVRGGNRYRPLPAHWRREAAHAAAAAAALTWAFAESKLPSAAKLDVDANAALAAELSELSGLSEQVAGAVDAVEPDAPEGTESTACEHTDDGDEHGEELAIPSEGHRTRDAERENNAQPIVTLNLRDANEQLAPFNLQLSLTSCRTAAGSAAEAAATATLRRARADLDDAEPAAATAAYSNRATGAEAAVEVLLDGVVYDGVEAGRSRAAVAALPSALGTRVYVNTNGAAFLLALEQALWSELVETLRLSSMLRAASAAAEAGEKEVDASTAAAARPMQLPDELLMLLPPAPAQGWPRGMPHEASSAEWLRRWEYPPVRRAQRLSFLVAKLLPQLEPHTLLQASSVRERLQHAVVHLCEWRRHLVAARSLDDTVGGGRQP
jgi:Lon protease-like protein